MTYQAVMLPGSKHRQTQFIPSASLYDDCPEASLAMAYNWSHQSLAETPLGVYRAARAVGLCDPNGAATMAEVKAQAQNLKLAVPDFRDWTDQPWAGWLGFVLGGLEAGRLLIVETSYGQALVDLITTQGENAVDLRNHVLCIVGYHPGGYCAAFGRSLPEGFAALDPASFAGNNDRAHNFLALDQMQFYSLAAMSAASIRAALTISPVVTIGVRPVWNVGSDGWATSQSGKRVGPGIWQAIVAGGRQAVDALTAELPYDATGAEAVPMADGSLALWSKEHGSVFAPAPAGSAVFAFQSTSTQRVIAPDALIVAKAAKYDAIKNACTI